MATPSISPHKSFNRIPQTLPIRETMTGSWTGSNGSFLNCSVRHVKGDNLSQCRFSYAMWCPVCEDHESCKRSYRGSRRRSKSEGMEIERSKEYYKKATNKSRMNYCDQPSNKSGNQLLRRLSNNENSTCQVHSFPTNIERSYASNGLTEYYLSHNEEKPSKHVFKPCENHIESKSVNYETWNFTNSRVSNQKDNNSLPLHEQYYYEVELLRGKLKKIRDNCDEIQLQPQYNVQKPSLLEVGTKRPRDYSPLVHTVSTSDKVASMSLSNAIRKSTPASSTSCLLSSGSTTSVSSDSVIHYSGCEEDGKVDTDPEAEEDDQALYYNAKAGVSFSYSPSHLMGSISLTDCDEVVNDSKQIHPALRASLFSHVPPYIRFFSHDNKGAALPPCVQKLLKWRMSTITPVVVRKTIVNSNFKLVRKSNEWCGTWGKHMKSLCFKTLREYQKINHFPGTFQIGRKDRLWKNLFRLMGKFGKKEFGFIPRTYVLPQDTKLLRSAWEKNCGNERWIVKPPASARGTGIKVIHKWTQIPKKCPLVVQKYISDPYLINGNKFDLRLYVLVTSINPLRIYLYDNGLVRFASVKYSKEMNSLNDRYMHLTNYSINKLSSQYTQNGDATACQGHKWSLHALWTYLKKQQVNVQALKNHLEDLVIKTIISGESAISQLSHANLASRYCSYELFGVDVLLDENLKPWLLEVNISPSLHSTSPLDLAVKGPMVRDLMNIAGFHIPNKLSSQVHADLIDILGVESNLCYDRRLYITAISAHERLKQTTFQQYEAREDYLGSILQDLTSDDVRHLIQFEDELTQLGNFQKIFPTTETYSYHQFFDNPRYYNMLFDAWEVKQSKNRNTGITLLESLCRKECHLDITQIPPKRTKVSMSLSENDLRTLEQDLQEENAEDEALSIVPDKIKERWTLMLACSAICRVAHSRSNRPNVINKPYLRSAYIARRALKNTHIVS